uniref:Uncharacterized protein n=1 Tax=Malurus cyaneus samueli TaxID=2593467 RepID=A0A8C5TGK1_9PASS
VNTAWEPMGRHALSPWLMLREASLLLLYTIFYLYLSHLCKHSFLCVPGDVLTHSEKSEDSLNF